MSLFPKEEKSAILAANHLCMSPSLVISGRGSSRVSIVIFREDKTMLPAGREIAYRAYMDPLVAEKQGGTAASDEGIIAAEEGPQPIRYALVTNIGDFQPGGYSGHSGQGHQSLGRLPRPVIDLYRIAINDICVSQVSVHNKQTIYFYPGTVKEDGS